MITTSQGFCFPLAITNGLAYLEMRPYTQQEYQDCPHVIMTSDQIWNPRKYDDDIDLINFKKAIPEDLHLLPNRDYNLAGQLIGINKTEFNSPDEPMCRFWIPETDYHQAEVVARCSYGAKLSKTAKHPKIAHASNSSHNYWFGPREHTPSPIDYEILKPFFC